MSFIISKIFWVLAQPSNALLLVLILAALIWRIRPILARRLLWTVVLFLVLVTLLPVGQWLLLPVERRFPELSDLPSRVDGIVVLGGGVDVGPSLERVYLELNGAAERLTVSAEVARRRPEARLIYSGLRGRLVDVSIETPDVAGFYARQGVDGSRIVIEEASRNTIENAVFSKELAKPSPDDVWLLITSAAHMPRAVGIFRKLGWPVIAMPVDFRRPRHMDLRHYLSLMAQPKVSDRLGELDHAVKAWVGLGAYWMMGRTDTLFPGP